MSSYRGKRLLDLAISVPGLLLTFPAQAAIAMMVAIKLGRPILFRQIRPGLGGRPFELIKFRTMQPIDNARGLIDDESRMTAFGRSLRASSLDELPSLWNVVRGDMSIVGPRPLLMQYLNRYTASQARRHDVKPGITGLAQVSGRNGISWSEKFALDVKYVQEQSLSSDIRILGRTILSVLRRENVNSLGQATTTEFLGCADLGPLTIEEYPPLCRSSK